MATDGIESIKYPCSIYKYTFELLDHNLYGVGYVIFNIDDKHIHEKEVVLYSSPNKCDLRISTGWRSFIEALRVQVTQSNFEKNTCEDILDNIESNITFNDIVSIERHIRDNQIKRITDTFKVILGRVLINKNIIMHSEVEMIDKEAFEEYMNLQIFTSNNKINAQEDGEDEVNVQSLSLHKENDPVGNKNESIFDLEEGNVLLDCYPLLAPISGVPVFELRINDQIMVKVTDDPNNKQVISEIESHRDGEPIPIRATVKKVQIKEKIFYILVHIKDHFYGRIIEAEQVKIKPYVEEIETSPEKEKISKASLLPAMRTVGIIAFSMVIFLLILMLFFLFR